MGGLLVLLLVIAISVIATEGCSILGLGGLDLSVQGSEFLGFRLMGFIGSGF